MPSDLNWEEPLCRLRVNGDVSLFKRVAGGVDGNFIWVTFSYAGDKVISMRTDNGRSWECCVPMFVYDPTQVGDNDYLCVTTDIGRLHDKLRENAGLRLAYNERDDVFTVWFGITDGLGGIRFAHPHRKLHRSSEGTLSINMQSLRDIAGILRRSVSDLERRVQALAKERGLCDFEMLGESLRDLYPLDMEASVLASEGFLRDVRDPPRCYHTFPY